MDRSINASGAVIYWRSAGAMRDAVSTALATANLHPSYLPTEISRQEAIKQALVSIFGGVGGGFRIEPLKNGRKGYGCMKISGSLYRDLTGENSLTIELYETRVSSFYECRFHDPDTIKPESEVRIRAEVDRIAGTIEATSLATMLASIIAGPCMGVKLREGGGVWWVPATKIERMREIRVALQAAVPGLNIGILTVQIDDDSVRAAIEAIRTEASTLAADINADLQKGLTDSRAISYRRSRIEATRARIAEYEASLGTALPDIKNALNIIDTGLVLSSMGQFDTSGFSFPTL